MSQPTYRCLLLVRVSTVGQHDGEGADLQMDRGFKCAKERFNIPREQVKPYVETWSGRKEERPHLEEVYDIVAAERIKLVLFYDIDRLTRAGPGFYERTKKRFQALGAEIADVKGIIQPSTNLLAGSGGGFGDDFVYEWSEHSPSEKAEVLEAQMAKDEARKILSRTIPVQIKNAQAGLTTRRAPYGYNNCKIIGEHGQPQASREVNEEEAYFVRKIFELKLQGRSTEAIAREVNALGFKTRSLRRWSKDKSSVVGSFGGNPISCKEVTRILRRPDYAGFNVDKWTKGYPVPANHSKIVDLTQWNLANTGHKQLVQSPNNPSGWELTQDGERKAREYRLEHQGFPFKSQIHCPGCDRPVTGSFSKGKSGKRYGYYHCGARRCGIRLSSTQAHQILRETLAALRFTPAAAERFEQHLRELWIDKVGDANARLTTLSTQIAEQRQEADGIFERLKLARSPLVIERLEAEFEEIMAQVETLEAKRTDKEHHEDQINRVLAFARYLIEHLDELVLDTQHQGLRAVYW